MKIDYTKIPYVDLEDTMDTLRDSIEKHGVGVIRGVLNTEKCARTIALGNEFLATTFANDADNVKMDKPETWRNVTASFGAKHGGLIQHFGVGQSEMAWSVREDPTMRAIFEKLWNTKDLIVSFDGVNITPPPEVTRMGWQAPDKHWLHADQGSRKPGLRSIQGLVNLVDVDVGDATLLVLRNSNVHHTAFFRQFTLADKGDWVRITDEHVAWFIERGCDLMAVRVRAGDAVFWDSRTIHMGLSPAPGRSAASSESRTSGQPADCAAVSPKGRASGQPADCAAVSPKGRWRYVVYVAMFPRASLTPHQLRKRADIYVPENRTTNHWGTKLFSVTPHTYGAPIPAIRKHQSPSLSPVAKKLV